MKKIMLAVVFTIASAGLLHAEENAPDFILRKGQDTIFCDITELDRSTTGVVNNIEYLDKNRSLQVIKGREETEKVISLRIAGIRMELLPLQPASPDGNKRHMEIGVDGKIQMIEYGQLNADTNSKGKRQLNSSTEISYYFRLDNGKFYVNNNKNTDDILVPALNRCAAFRSGFTEKINIRTLYDAVEYYNKHCSE